MTYGGSLGNAVVGRALIAPSTENFLRDFNAPSAGYTLLRRFGGSCGGFAINSRSDGWPTLVFVSTLRSNAVEILQCARQLVFLRPSRGCSGLGRRLKGLELKTRRA